MATVDISSGIGAGTHPSRAVRKAPYVVETTLNLADATTAKGSALAAADVIEIIDVPAGSVILAAGIESASGVNGQFSVDLGVAGVDADVWVDGFALGSAVADGTYSQFPAAYQPVMCSGADTIDVVIATATGVPSVGDLRVWAMISDVSENLGPVDVDRDQLA
jgi:hypothetical protein